MVIGFDAKRAFNNSSGLGNYSRSTIMLLTGLYPENLYLLYTPKIDGKIVYTAPSGCLIKKPGKLTEIFAGSLWRSLGIGRQLEKDGVDIFHGLSHELPLNIPGGKVKKIVTIHDMISFRHPGMFKTINSYIYRKKISFSCKTANTVIAVSRQTKDDITEFLDTDPDKIRVVCQTCDPLFFKKTTGAMRTLIGEKYNLPSCFILFVGTIEQRKNLESVIRAIRIGGIDLPLLVIGKKTQYFAKILKTIKSERLRHVTFLENVPVEDLAAIYQMADVFVYPSFYEGFGIPVLEALVSGTPVITSSGSSLKETAGPDSIYIDPRDNRQLAYELSRVLTDSGLRRKMIYGGLKHAENFRHENIAGNIMDVYKSTIKSNDHD